MMILPLKMMSFVTEDVKSVNPDNSTNDCTKCCAARPPFEISSDYDGRNVTAATWTMIPRDQIVIAGETITLKMAAGENAATTQGVRYAWSDFVDCVLVNGDGLPAGPFVQQVGKATLVDPDSKKAATSAMLLPNLTANSAPSIPKSALSPPMGFNSWNFYHCNIDENTVKQVI